LDEILFRVLKNGNQYQSLFPTSTGEIVELGKGDTDYSIDKMVQWIEKYQTQTTKVAKLHEKSSLQETCRSIHEFCYWHFQYKQDAADQLLRSPAAAWKQRFDGIDCKSYSIIASCILLNLDINHYIRKVGYSVPGEYTHVYVIVPKNQQTNDLNDGFYMIDGTINTMQEPNYLDEKDEFMSLQHYGLNAPSQLNGFSLADLKKLDLKSLSGLLSSLKCIGGSAYSSTLLDANLAKLTALVNDIIVSINTSIANGDMETLANDYTDFIGYTSALHEGHSYVAAYESWNPCTMKNLIAFQVACEYFIYKVFPALTAYIDKYFDKTPNGTKPYTNAGLEAQGWTFMETQGHGFNQNYDFFNLKFKSLVTPIPAFEFTAPLLNATTASTPIDIQDFLNSLQTIISIVNPNGNTNGSNGSNGNYEYIDSNTPTTSNAGFNWIIGLGILAAGYAVATLGENATQKNIK
jgi:hypothetical protein